MKTLKIIILIFVQNALLISQNLQIGGYIQADDRVKIKDKTISWEEYRLNLTGKVESEKVKLYSEVWIRNFGSNNVKKISDLSDRNYVEPFDIKIREAYVDVKDFLVDNLDLRVGRQRIAWGTADKLNPTDNLNPDDLEDIWDYGRHLGSNALKLSYYIGDFTFTGVLSQHLRPAVLPRGDWIKIFSAEFSETEPNQFEISDSIIKIQNPDASLKEASKFALKISKRNILGFDISLSYVHGRDDIPIISKIFAKPSSLDSIILFFPRIEIVGFDFTGDIKGVGIWGEIGIFYPEEVISETLVQNIPIQRKTILERKNYTRFVLGFDYTFRNGVYANVQYLHGFLHERGRGNLKNYIVFNLERKFMNDKLTLNFLSGGFEFKRAKDIKKNHALIYNPQISYSPIDNIELIIGGRIIESKGRTTFGRLRDNDEVI